MRLCFLLLFVVVALLGCGPQHPEFTAADIRVRTNAVPIHLTAEIDRARKENKLLVLQFTGSDWCYPCMLFDKQIYQNPQFQSYLTSNLVYLEVDLPQRTPLPDDVMKTNLAIARQFQVNTFPSTIVLDHGGKEIWRNPGFEEGGPEPFINKLEVLRRQVAP